ncbi:MAG: twin-arginine translocase TatA/TatE family subunit [Anaerolineales bacterium]|nr:twin-arginine translocase TatA/TatE family subunit [Anaerolineales bacterium]MCS7247078.1 twin-arginine translocase TatA/TatE family subunit [Anaerolineales bacterium]MDW8160889.1 twin-arginine translocase TatA/TatE family subunit [Anaerolineales bacterium]MDW8447558.1 twin-arginine translocase TatA/TatE family subunit [Anaerolineales bacterium]
MLNLPQGAELLIILFIVILLFGVGRISRVAGEFGKAIRAFKEGLQSSTEEATEQKAESTGEGKSGSKA